MPVVANKDYYYEQFLDNIDRLAWKFSSYEN